MSSSDDDGNDDENLFWHDREIRFDINAQRYELRRGEFYIDTLDNVEDTKGNNGESGMLIVTNLRILWHSTKNPAINLSIGIGSMLNISISNTNSRLKGSTQALFVSAKFGASRYEFTFTYLVADSPRLFTTVTAVWRAYDSTRMFRDLKLRAAIIVEDELLLLPDEQVFTKMHGVWNLSSDAGTLGVLYITNIRVVWHSKVSEAFNVSIPYIQIISFVTRETKFGTAFVITSSPYAGNYVLGFRVDPPEKLPDLYKEAYSMWQLYSTNPVLGVSFDLEQAPSTLDQQTIKKVVDGLNLIEEVPTDAFQAYYADEGQKTSDRKPVFDDTYLGLAVERVKDGLTVEQLWNVPT